MTVAPGHCTYSHGHICQVVSDQIMGHPPYSPDLVPFKLFFYFLWLNLAKREPILPQLKKFSQSGESLEGPSKKSRSKTFTSNFSPECRSA
ncbi:hypothetical protein TNCV_3439651 [Trichonephila clavipes]|nr:hypothetical protein TNCV_3439651 [Trichonephila clavipes]